MAAYWADVSNRVRVTADWAWNHLADATLWMLDVEAHENGLDGWREIELDKSTTGNSYFLLFGQSGQTSVDPQYPVYVQRKDLSEDTIVPVGPRLHALLTETPGSRGGFSKHGGIRVGENLYATSGKLEAAKAFIIAEAAHLRIPLTDAQADRFAKAALKAYIEVKG